MYKCPECESDNIETERRPDGDSRCVNCGYRDATEYFKPEESIVDELKTLNISHEKKFEMLFDENLTKTRFVAFPDHADTASKRMLFFTDHTNRLSAKEAHVTIVTPLHEQIKEANEIIAELHSVLNSGDIEADSFTGQHVATYVKKYNIQLEEFDYDEET
jgi:hypothetical protein